ncbi:MAG: PqqD family protein [Acidobacteriota bacterium]
MQSGPGAIPAVRVIINDDVLFRQLDDEAVLLDLDSQRYFGLDAVGTRLWALLQEDPSLPRAREILLAEFDAGPEVLDGDLEVFLSELVERELVKLEGLDEPSG